MSGIINKRKRKAESPEIGDVECTGQLLEAGGSLWECSVCKNTYRPPIRITHCGHSFCHDCLVSHATHCAKRGSSFNCPGCKKIIKKSPENLTRNYDLERAVESRTNSDICKTHGEPKKLYCVKHGIKICCECHYVKKCGRKKRSRLCDFVKYESYNVKKKEKMKKMQEIMDHVVENTKEKFSKFIEKDARKEIGKSLQKITKFLDDFEPQSDEEIEEEEIEEEIEEKEEADSGQSLEFSSDENEYQGMEMRAKIEWPIDSDSD